MVVFAIIDIQVVGIQVTGLAANIEQRQAKVELLVEIDLEADFVLLGFDGIRGLVGIDRVVGA